MPDDDEGPWPALMAAFVVGVVAGWVFLALALALGSRCW